MSVLVTVQMKADLSRASIGDGLGKAGRTEAIPNQERTMAEEPGRNHSLELVKVRFSIARGVGSILENSWRKSSASWVLVLTVG